MVIGRDGDGAKGIGRRCHPGHPGTNGVADEIHRHRSCRRGSLLAATAGRHAERRGDVDDPGCACGDDIDGTGVGEIRYRFDSGRRRVVDVAEGQADTVAPLAAEGEAATDHDDIRGIGRLDERSASDRGGSGDVREPGAGRVFRPHHPHRTGAGGALLAGGGGDRCRDRDDPAAAVGGDREATGAERRGPVDKGLGRASDVGDGERAAERRGGLARFRLGEGHAAGKGDDRGVVFGADGERPGIHHAGIADVGTGIVGDDVDGDRSRLGRRILRLGGVGLGLAGSL